MIAAAHPRVLAPAKSRAPRSLKLEVLLPRAVKLNLLASYNFPVRITNPSAAPVTFETRLPWGIRIVLYDSRGRSLCDYEGYFGRFKFAELSPGDFVTLDPGKSMTFRRRLFAVRSRVAPGLYTVSAQLLRTPRDDWPTAVARAVRNGAMRMWTGPNIESARRRLLVTR